MSCAKYRERLDELAMGELSPGPAREVRAHVAACKACGRVYRETAATLSLLHRLGEASEEALPDDYALSLHNRLVLSGPPDPPSAMARLGASLRDLLAGSGRRIAFGVGGGAVMAAALVLAFVAGSHRSSWKGSAVASGEVAPIFVVPKAKVAVVRIDFHAEEDVEDVEFAIKLPEGLHFVSEGRELPDREFHWRGRLERGSNPIPVAVRGRRAGRYTLTAHAVGPDVVTRHDVVLEVTS